MEDDYFSIDAILSENQVSIIDYIVLINTDAVHTTENPVHVQANYPRHGPSWRRLGTRCKCLRRDASFVVIDAFHNSDNRPM